MTITAKSIISNGSDSDNSKTTNGVKFVVILLKAVILHFVNIPLGLKDPGRVIGVSEFI